MKIFLDDSHCRESLFPFTQTRHFADIRLGILTLREKWQQITGYAIETNGANLAADAIHIPANIIPTVAGLPAIMQAVLNKVAVQESEDVKILQHPWQIFQLNGWAIKQDYELITSGRASEPIPDTVQCSSGGHIFLEEGVKMSYATLNASAGAIYIGKNVEIMEGSLIRGPFAACESAVIKMGSKIYGASTIGPGCVAGGEIKNAVMFGYSNKAHDGYLGDSVIGEWCNLGAGTSNSNVKNTGGEVRYTLQPGGPSVSAGNKAGLLMGDYSRSAINSSFNTGTVVGVCCNIFGEMPGTQVPNFSWGKERYRLDKALADIANWKKMKGQDLSPQEAQVIKELYSISTSK